jgi:hypothetical protein
MNTMHDSVSERTLAEIDVKVIGPSNRYNAKSEIWQFVAIKKSLAWRSRNVPFACSFAAIR